MNVLPRLCRELAQGEQEEGIGLSQKQTELHIHLVSHQATKAWTKVAVCWRGHLLGSCRLSLTL